MLPMAKRRSDQRLQRGQKLPSVGCDLAFQLAARRIQPLDLLASRAEHLGKRADFVRGGIDHAVLVAGDARQAVDNLRRTRSLQVVANHGDRSGVDAVVLTVDQQVSLQAVGQMKDHLAAVVVKRQLRERMPGEDRSQREL